MSEMNTQPQTDTYIPDLVERIRSGVITAEDAVVLLANAQNISTVAAETILALNLGAEFSDTDKDTLVWPEEEGGEPSG